VYEVGLEDSEDDSIFEYFNPKKKKGQATGMTTKSSKKTKSKKFLSRNIGKNRNATEQLSAINDFEQGTSATSKKVGIEEQAKRLGGFGKQGSQKRLNPIKSQSMIKGSTSGKGRDDSVETSKTKGREKKLQKSI